MCPPCALHVPQLRRAGPIQTDHDGNTRRAGSSRFTGMLGKHSTSLRDLLPAARLRFPAPPLFRTAPQFGSGFVLFLALTTRTEPWRSTSLTGRRRRGPPCLPAGSRCPRSRQVNASSAVPAARSKVVFFVRSRSNRARVSRVTSPNRSCADRTTLT